MVGERKRRTKWAYSTAPDLRHFKISFDLNRDLSHIIRHQLKDLITRVLPAFVVAKHGGYTYSVYYGGWVNCCGARNLIEAAAGVRHFKVIAGFIEREDEESLESQVYQVDNITACGHLAMDLRLTDIARSLPELIPQSVTRSKYRPTHFRSIHLNFPKNDGGGAMALFHTGLVMMSISLFFSFLPPSFYFFLSSGKYSLVGVKSSDRALHVYTKVREILQLLHAQHDRILL